MGVTCGRLREGEEPKVSSLFLFAYFALQKDGGSTTHAPVYETGGSCVKPTNQHITIHQVAIM